MTLRYGWCNQPWVIESMSSTSNYCTMCPTKSWAVCWSWRWTAFDSLGRLHTGTCLSDNMDLWLVMQDTLARLRRRRVRWRSKTTLLDGTRLDLSRQTTRLNRTWRTISRCLLAGMHWWVNCRTRFLRTMTARSSTGAMIHLVSSIHIRSTAAILYFKFLFHCTADFVRSCHEFGPVQDPRL